MIGREAVVDYQRNLQQSVSRTRTVDQELTVSADGTAVFASSTGDHETTDGQPCTNVYLFRFDIAGDRSARVTEYCNPVTYA